MGDLEKRKQAGTWHAWDLGTGSLVALQWWKGREDGDNLEGERIPGRENGKCKGSEAGWYLEITH